MGDLGPNRSTDLASDVAADLSPTYNPGNDLPTIQHFWRADTSVVFGAAPVVSTWTDSVSGVVASGLNDPEQSASDAAANGRAVMDLGVLASDKRFTIADASFQTNFGGTAQWTIGGVLPDGASLNNRFFSLNDDPSTPTEELYVYVGSGTTLQLITVAAGTSVFNSGLSVAVPPQKHFWAIKYDGAGNIRAFLNGTFANASGSHRTLSSLAYGQLGNRVGGNSASRSVAEMFFCTSQISDADLVDWYDYATARYGGP